MKQQLYCIWSRICVCKSCTSTMVDMNLDATKGMGAQKISEVCFYILATSNSMGSFGLICMWPRAQLVIGRYFFYGLLLIFLDTKARPIMAYPIPSTSSSSLSRWKLPKMVLYSMFSPTQQSLLIEFD